MTRWSAGLLAMFAVLRRISPAVMGQLAAGGERFSTTAVLRADANVVAPIEITIEDWSSADERVMLLRLFQGGGVSGLLTGLRTARRLGSVRSGDHFSREVHYAFQTRASSGARHIVVLMDQPFLTHELLGAATSSDPAISAMALWISAHGDGEGQAVAGDKLRGTSSDEPFDLDERNPPIIFPAVHPSSAR